MTGRLSGGMAGVQRGWLVLLALVRGTHLLEPCVYSLLLSGPCK